MRMIADETAGRARRHAPRRRVVGRGTRSKRRPVLVGHPDAKHVAGAHVGWSSRPVTRAIRGIPTEVRLGPDDGLPDESRGRVRQPATDAPQLPRSNVWATWRAASPTRSAGRLPARSPTADSPLAPPCLAHRAGRRVPGRGSASLSSSASRRSGRGSSRARPRPRPRWRTARPSTGRRRAELTCDSSSSMSGCSSSRSDALRSSKLFWSSRKSSWTSPSSSWASPKLPAATSSATSPKPSRTSERSSQTWSLADSSSPQAPATAIVSSDRAGRAPGVVDRVDARRVSCHGRSRYRPRVVDTARSRGLARRGHPAAPAVNPR